MRRWRHVLLRGSVALLVVVAHSASPLAPVSVQPRLGSLFDVWAVAGPAGSDAQSCGSSPVTPCATLAAAVNRAAAGATLHVMYSSTAFGCSSSGTFIDVDISIVGSANAAGQRPVIDCQGVGRAFQLSVNSSTATHIPKWHIESIEIRNGNAPIGGGIFAAAEPTVGGMLSLKDVKIQNCHSTGRGLPLLVLGSYSISIDNANAGGGGVYAFGVSFAAQQSDFISNEANSLNSMGGAVALFNSAAPYHKTHFIIENCTWMKNSCQGIGGALALQAFGGARDVAISVLNCIIAENKAVAPVMQYNRGGGGLAFTFSSSVLTPNSSHIANLSISVDNSTFDHNIATLVPSVSDKALSGGGGLLLSVQAKGDGISVAVDRTVFSNNTVSGMSGGGTFIQFADTPAFDVSVNITNSSVSGNAASYDGAGIMVDVPAEPPSNLAFVNCIPTTGHDRCPEAEPMTNLPGRRFREWGNGTSTSRITISDTLIAQNRGTTPSSAGGGITCGRGALMQLVRCVIVKNECGRTGGGIHVRSGATRVLLESSNLSENLCRSGIGNQITDLSGGLLNLQSNTIIDLTGSASGQSGIYAFGIGQVDIDTAASVICPTGYKLINESFLGRSETFFSWKLTSADCACWSNALGLDVLYPDVLSSTLHYNCVPCPLDSYSFSGGSSHGYKVQAVTCKPCVYGAFCYGADQVAVAKDFWPAFSSSLPNASFRAHKCPVDYCCHNHRCNITLDGDICNGNRTGRLCGECAQNFSQTFGSAACKPTTSCNQWWYFIVSIVVAFFYARYLLIMPTRREYASSVQLRNVDLIACITPLLYFYQQVHLVDLSGAAKAFAVQTIVSALSLDIRVGHSSGWCAIPGLTTFAALHWHYLYPFLVAGMIGVIFAFDWAKRCRTIYKSHGPGVAVEVALRSANDAKAAREFSDLSMSQVEHVLESYEDSSHKPVGNNDGVIILPKQASAELWITSYRLAFPKLLLLSYAKLTTTTLTLLHCVTISEKRYLYASAVHQCGSWQTAYYVIMVILFAPIVAFMGYVLLRRQTAIGTLTEESSLSTTVLFYIAQQYRPQFWYWEVVLLVQRVLLAVFDTFLQITALRIVAQLVICVVCLCLQIAIFPFKGGFVNNFQTLLQFALCVVCCCSTQIGGLTTRAAPTPQRDNPIYGVEDDYLVATTVVQVVPLVIIFFFICWYNCERCTRCMHDDCCAKSKLPRKLANVALVRNDRGLRLTGSIQPTEPSPYSLMRDDGDGDEGTLHVLPPALDSLQI